MNCVEALSIIEEAHEIKSHLNKLAESFNVLLDDVSIKIDGAYVEVIIKCHSVQSLKLISGEIDKIIDNQITRKWRQKSFLSSQ